MKYFTESSQNLTVFELTVPNLYQLYPEHTHLFLVRGENSEKKVY